MGGDEAAALQLFGIPQNKFTKKIRTSTSERSKVLTDELGSALRSGLGVGAEGDDLGRDLLQEDQIVLTVLRIKH